MLSSLAYLFIISLFFAYIFRKIGLPTLIGMLITGMLLGPYGINILDKSILKGTLIFFILVIYYKLQPHSTSSCSKRLP